MVAGELGCRSADACATVQIPDHRSEAPMTIYFYGADEVPYGCFSNFSGHGFDLDGHWWTTSEHYFQAQKFPGTRHAEFIRRTPNPLRAAELGRDRSRPLRRDWERVKDDVMRRAVTAKFTAHADIRAILLDTGDEEIVEDTSTDHYWGRGRSGTGKNMLGRILMRTRTQLGTDLTQNDGTPGRRQRRQH